jgi:hypothetical protein
MRRSRFLHLLQVRNRWRHTEFQWLRSINGN